MTTTEPKKIIIVEDEPDTAEMFAEMMRLSGYHVLKSYGGTPAIALISHEIIRAGSTTSPSARSSFGKNPCNCGLC